MNRRNFCRSLSGTCLIAVAAAQAQAPRRMWRIGYLGSTPPLPQAFQQAMERLGYVSGTTAVFEARFSEGHEERFPAFVAELLRLDVDVLVTIAPAIAAAKAATTRVPIVMNGVSDPVGRGLVASFAHPGGNITGVANLQLELNAKRIEMLKSAVPRTARVVSVTNYIGWDRAKLESAFAEQDAAVGAIGVTVRRIEIDKPEEFDSVSAAIARERPDGLLLTPVPLTYRLRREFAAFALAQRLPTVGWHREQAEAGVLMTYGPNNDDIFRLAAIYVDKVLKGAKPADLPVEQPTKFDLVINLKAAKALGITIPQSVLGRADEVIQ
jgi:putative ABC transport system substrate-binding protein